MLTETIVRSAKYLSNIVQAKELNRPVTYYIARDSVSYISTKKT